MKKNFLVISSILFLLAIGTGFGLIIGNDYTFNTNNQFSTREGFGFDDTGWPYHCQYTTVHAENVGVSADFQAPYDGSVGGCEYTLDAPDYAYQYYRTNIFEVQTTGYYNVHFTYKIDGYVHAAWLGGAAYVKLEFKHLEYIEYWGWSTVGSQTVYYYDGGHNEEKLIQLNNLYLTSGRDQQSYLKITYYVDGTWFDSSIDQFMAAGIPLQNGGVLGLKSVRVTFVS